MQCYWQWGRRKYIQFSYESISSYVKEIRYKKLITWWLSCKSVLQEIFLTTMINEDTGVTIYIGEQNCKRKVGTNVHSGDADDSPSFSVLNMIQIEAISLQNYISWEGGGGGGGQTWPHRKPVVSAPVISSALYFRSFFRSFHLLFLRRAEMTWCFTKFRPQTIFPWEIRYIYRGNVDLRCRLAVNHN